MTNNTRKDKNTPDRLLIIGQEAIIYGLPQQYEKMEGIIVQILQRSGTNTHGLKCQPDEVFYCCETPLIQGGLLLIDQKYLAHIDIYDRDTISRYRSDPPKQLPLAQ